MKDRIELTEDHLDIVLSYVDGIYRVMTELELSKFDLKDLLLDHNIEECPFCNNFTESCFLLEDNEPDGYCDNCRRYNKLNDD